MPDKSTKPPFRFIAIALGILALLFVIGSWNLPIEAAACPNKQQSQGDTNTKCQNNPSPTIGFFIRTLVADGWDFVDNKDRLLVIFTAALATFTFFLFKATEGLLRHAPQIERAYISGIGNQRMQIIEERDYPQIETRFPGQERYRVRQPTSIFELCVSNHGKTPGEITKIGYGFCDSVNVPARPNYKVFAQRIWVGPGVTDLPVQIFGIPSEIPYPAFYARIYYRDIFGKKHSSGFVIRTFTLTVAQYVIAPEEYTNSD